MPLIVSVNTNYPWDGRITVTVDEAPSDREWTLALRIPQWCTGFAVQSPNQPGTAPADTADTADGWLRLTRNWQPGERVVLELDMEPRLTAADPRVDAARGCVAIERGPLVYCLEQVDHPGGGLDDIVLDTTRPLAEKHRPDLLGGVTTVLASGYRRRIASPGWWPYTSQTTDTENAATRTTATTADDPIELVAIPYYAWANRNDGAMRVWLPTS